MAQVTCTRCFSVFEADEGRAGSAPLCPACAPRAPRGAQAARPAAGTAFRTPARRGRRAGLAAAVAGLLGLGVAVAAFLLLRRPEAPAPAAPRVVDLRVEEWRAARLLPAAAGVPDPGRARLRAAQGFEALDADAPARTAEALQAFREAIALEPGRSAAAVGGYAFAFGDTLDDEADGPELRAVHDMVREALAGSPDEPELLAGYARLLLAVPSASNLAEATGVAVRAVRGAPGSTRARLALGLARLAAEPAEGVRILEEALAAAPGDRRLLTAAARARWAAGDAAGALAHADARLALDRGQPDVVALRAEIELASERIPEARATLARWEAMDPGSPLPPLLLARIAYQQQDDTTLARRLLEVALSRSPGAFTAARILAHRAAVEIQAGDAAAAEAAVEEALRRVPGSAPARFQAALLAFRRGNAAALRESAGVLGDRAGPRVRALLSARSTELSGTEDEAQEAYLAAADASPADPAALLGLAGALARLRASGPALEVARRALARDVAEGRLRRAPTDFHEGLGPLAEAARRLEAIGRGEPSAAGVAFAAAAACELLLGRTVAAERLAKEAVAAAPQATAPHVLLAQIAVERGEPRAAGAPLRSALELRPGDAPALAVRARALAAVGRTLDAEGDYRRALESAPDLVTARLGLARLLARRGEAAAARALLEALLRDDPGLTEARGALLALSEARAPVRPAARRP